MNLEKVFLLKAIISIAFGAVLIILPKYLMILYGVELSPIGALLARFFGASLMGIGLICWFAKSAVSTVFGQGAAFSLCIADTIGFIVSLIGQMANLTNNFGWSIVAVWFVFAFGLGYFRFLKPAAS